MTCRYMVAVAGCPGSGKTTAASLVQKMVNKRAPHFSRTHNAPFASVASMDGEELKFWFIFTQTQILMYLSIWCKVAHLDSLCCIHSMWELASYKHTRASLQTSGEKSESSLKSL